MQVIEKDADVPTIFYYQPNVFDNKELEFVKEFNFREGTKNVTRKQLWFHEGGKYFCEKWIRRHKRWESNRYTDKLIKIQKKVQNITDRIIDDSIIKKHISNPIINSCLVNYYRDGTQFIPPHKDTNLSFGRYPTIIGISYGDSRIFTLKNKMEKHSYILQSGSIFIMAGSSQKYYTHEIERSDSIDSRYSLTFRQYID